MISLAERPSIIIRPPTIRQHHQALEKEDADLPIPVGSKWPVAGECNVGCWPYTMEARHVHTQPFIDGVQSPLSLHTPSILRSVGFARTYPACGSE